MRCATVATRVGPFTVIANSAGEVVAAGFTTDVADLLSLVHPSLRGDPRPVNSLGPITDAVLSYVEDDLTAIYSVPVRAYAGGEFIGVAWDTLREIKPGQPVTYTQLATLAGRPRAVRAAAQACARNPVALFVPCHRVVRTDGSLGGYRWGLPIKRWLLDHEREPR